MGTRQEKREFAHNSIVVLVLFGGTLGNGREFNTSSDFRYRLALAYILLKRKETRRQFLKDIT